MSQRIKRMKGETQHMKMIIIIIIKYRKNIRNKGAERARKSKEESFRRI